MPLSTEFCLFFGLAQHTKASNVRTCRVASHSSASKGGATLRASPERCYCGSLQAGPSKMKRSSPAERIGGSPIYGRHHLLSSACAFLVAVAGCADPVLAPQDLPSNRFVEAFTFPDYVTSLAPTVGAESVMYAGSRSSLWRTDGSLSQWTLLTAVPGGVRALSRARGDTIIGINGQSEVFRWTAGEGLETLLTRATLDSLLLSLSVDPAEFFGLLSLAVDSREVFAVGGNGVVLRWNTTGWAADTLLSLSSADSPADAAVLWRIHGSTDSLFAVSAEAVYGGDRTQWRVVQDSIALPGSCVPLSVVRSETRLWVAGGTPPCILLRRDIGWKELPLGLTTGFFGDMDGDSQGTIAWDERGAFVLLTDEEIRVYRTEFENLEGVLSLEHGTHLVLVASAASESTLYSMKLGGPR